MHLLGIKSRTFNAEEFYLQCEKHNNGEEAEITIGDCSPAGVHNRNTVNIKSTCCVELFHIENAKYMKVGNKNKINQHVDFEYAYGREYATLGFHKKGNGNAFPITCMTKGIDEYCTHKHKIVFIFEKKSDEIKYTGLRHEIKKDILKDCYKEFPKELQEKIAAPMSIINL